MVIGDLRFGNNIHQGVITMVGYSDGVLGVYYLENKYSSFMKFLKLDDVVPIEIDGDILCKKLGFEKDGSIYTRSCFEIMKLPNSKFEFMNHDYPVSIKYVHKLQNLYYELMNEEISL